jgi:uncharacterized protein YqgC (DUF456 family)
MGTAASITICSILMLAGLLGVILPVLPGVPLAWLGLFLYALGTGFKNVSVVTVIVFFTLMVLTLVIDFLAPAMGARKFWASKLGIIGAFLGSIVGIILLGFWGIILGPLAGAFLGELIARGKPKQALGSALGTFVGFVAGSLFKIVLILIMAGIFIASLF